MEGVETRKKFDVQCDKLFNSNSHLVKENELYENFMNTLVNAMNQRMSNKVIIY